MFSLRFEWQCISSLLQESLFGGSQFFLGSLILPVFFPSFLELSEGFQQWLPSLLPSYSSFFQLSWKIQVFIKFFSFAPGSFGRAKSVSWQVRFFVINYNYTCPSSHNWVIYLYQKIPDSTNKNGGIIYVCTGTFDKSYKLNCASCYENIAKLLTYLVYRKNKMHCSLLYTRVFFFIQLFWFV